MTSTRYSAVHERMRKSKGPASAHACVECGEPAAHWAYDGSDPEELTDLDHGNPVTYSADLGRYFPMCRSCHTKHDAARNPRTHCAQGHEFTGENTLLVSGKRRCRTCNRERCRAYGKRRSREGDVAIVVS